MASLLLTMEKQLWVAAPQRVIIDAYIESAAVMWGFFYWIFRSHLACVVGDKLCAA